MLLSGKRTSAVIKQVVNSGVPYFLWYVSNYLVWCNLWCT